MTKPSAQFVLLADLDRYRHIIIVYYAVPASGITHDFVEAALNGAATMITLTGLRSCC